MRRSFADQPDETTRIVVTHHPFEGPSANDDDGIVGRARMAMGVFSQIRVDVILSGHLHLNRIGSSAVRYDIEGYSALLIQAGTAISSRRRQEANSFNLIRIERPEIHLECRAWDLDKVRFVRSTSKSFRLGRSGWAPTGGQLFPRSYKALKTGLYGPAIGYMARHRLSDYANALTLRICLAHRNRRSADTRGTAAFRLRWRVLVDREANSTDRPASSRSIICAS